MVKPTVDYSFTSYNSNNDTTEALGYLLGLLASSLRFDLAWVVASSSDSPAPELLAQQGDAAAAADRDAILRLIAQSRAQATPASQPVWLDADALAPTGFTSGILFPLAMPDDVIGLLAVFARDDAAFTAAQVEAALPVLSLIRMTLENVHMYSLVAQSMIVTQSIQLAAREIAADPSPQHVINILRDYFFDSHVTSCALLLYGPIQEDQPDGPFEYMEVKGTWSRRRGSGIGVGLRFYLKDLPDLVAQLESEKVLIFPRARALTDRLDPLLRVFLQAERVRSLTLLGLQASQRRLGVLFIATDKRHDFTTAELNNYRTVSEFLAIHIMTQMLEEQHDIVQQGRAALLDAVTDGVLMVLPSADGARILTVNNRFRDLFGFGASGLHGLLLDEIIERMPFPEQERADLREAWLSISVRDPDLRDGEFQMIHEEGHPIDIAWYSAPVYQNTAVLGRIYIFHDISPERSAQRLRASFLSRVSHELRTPLTSIRGFAEFILEVTGPELPDLAREYTEIILSSARHLNAVFTDMIEITRAEAGELKLNREETHLPDIIIDVVARMELIYKKRNQQVVMELDDDLPPVSVDADRMIQVLTNLLTNAIKYSPENGVIRISTRYVTRPRQLPPSAPPDVVLPAILVTVADGGKGLSREDAEKVFMPFYRTEEVRLKKVEGVGLGLAVTRSMVEMHRGKIWAEPRKRGHRGGQFLFTVPTIEHQ